MLPDQLVYVIYCSSRNLALQDTGALAAAGYGQLVVWAHTTLLSGVGVAFTAAKGCISAGAPPRPLTAWFWILGLVFAVFGHPPPSPLRKRSLVGF